MKIDRNRDSIDMTEDGLRQLVKQSIEGNTGRVVHDVSFGRADFGPTVRILLKHLDEEGGTLSEKLKLPADHCRKCGGKRHHHPLCSCKVFEE